MSWGKVSDRLHAHSKFRRAREAMALWVGAMSWSCDELTDGVIPADMPDLILPGLGDAMAEKLVAVGLWERTETGYRFHDWGQYQPSGADEKARRAEVSRVRSEAGKRGNEKRWGSQTDRNAIANGSQLRSQTDRKGIAARSQTDRPDPDPEPEHEDRKEEDTSKPSPETDTPTLALVAPETDPKTGARAPSASAEVHRVFDHWRERLDHKGAKLDGKREALIRRALKSHGLAVVTAAVDGCAASEWHRGANPDGKRYDSLGLILRDAEHIERFASMATPTREGTASASGGGVTGVRPSAPTLAAHRPAVAPQLPTVGAPLTRPAFLRRTAEPVAATQTAEEDMPW